MCIYIYICIVYMCIYIYMYMCLDEAYTNRWSLEILNAMWILFVV